MEVTNILQIKLYEMTEDENVSIIKIWLGIEGLQLIQTFTNLQKETYKSKVAVFLVKFKPSHNLIILMSQYC